MKIVLADTPDTQVPNHEYEIKILQDGLKDCQVIVHDYDASQREAFLKEIEDADAILTAYIEIDKEAIDRASKLKTISVSATGFNNVDLEYASQKGIGVSPIGEYCTKDVAEFTICVMEVLVKNLKQHINNIEKNGKWEYDVASPNKRLENLTLGIVGLGKIGKETAKKAVALGMRVLATDPNVSTHEAEKIGVLLTTPEELLQQCDVISNHMNLNETNHNYFDYDFFKASQKQPYFINMGRAACVVEADLVRALDDQLIKGAALDVIANETEHLDLINHPLANRDNVIVTPHVAFYTTDSMEELIRISCENIVNFLNGDREKVFKLVNKDDI